MILKGYIFGIGYAAVCLLLSMLLYKLGLEKKYTRKVVHILVGFEWVILYHFMGAGVHFLAVCILFLLLLSVAYKGRLMPMIASDSDNAPGTVYYAIAMTGVAAVGCFVPSVMLPFGIGVMCTSLGDGLAGVAGQSIRSHNPKIYGNKSLLGTLTNVIASALSAFVIASVYSVELGIVSCIFVGILSAELELITPYGFDNISVTWGTTAFAYALAYFDGAEKYVIPALLSPIIIMLARSKRALTADGIIAAIVLDIAVAWAFGTAGFLILCLFFGGSIAIDKLKKRHRATVGSDLGTKGDCRDCMQVAANGLAAFVSAVALILTENAIFTVPFVASMAEAFADTAASGIGAFSKKTYDPFRLRKCEAGISGGISLIGTLASLIAAAFITVSAYLTDKLALGVKEVVIVIVSAFLGAFFDSLLGSLAQAKYKCSVCGKICEGKEHCGSVAELYSGLDIIDNDVVNLLSGSFAAILATFLTIVIV